MQKFINYIKRELEEYEQEAANRMVDEDQQQVLADLEWDALCLYNKCIDRNFPQEVLEDIFKEYPQFLPV